MKGQDCNGAILDLSNDKAKERKAGTAARGILSEGGLKKSRATGLDVSSRWYVAKDIRLEESW